VPSTGPFLVTNDASFRFSETNLWAQGAKISYDGYPSASYTHGTTNIVVANPVAAVWDGTKYPNVLTVRIR
jgi:hypothetical protein